MVNLVAGKGSSFPGTSERGRRAKEGEALEGRGEVSARRLVLSVSARQSPLAEMIMRPVMAAERFTLSTDRYLHVSAQEKKNAHSGAGRPRMSADLFCHRVSHHGLHDANHPRLRRAHCVTVSSALWPRDGPSILVY